MLVSTAAYDTELGGFALNVPCLCERCWAANQMIEQSDLETGVRYA